MTGVKPIPPTRPIEQAAEQVWDVVIVGAGPSGALAARELARYGVSVLLVDKAAFPRWKVCGSCVNAAALATLEAVGLGELPNQLGAQPLHELQLAAGRRRASLPLPGGVAVSRERFDAALIEHAIQAGADFLPHTHARLDRSGIPTRRLTLRQREQEVTVEARVVLAADGLGGRLVQHEKGFELSVNSMARFGASTIVDTAPSTYDRETIVMACGNGGYVGLVRLEDGRLNIAAAFDPSFVRQTGGPGEAATTVLAHTGLPPVRGLSKSSWGGTPALTCRLSRLVTDRLFVIGDAAGYIEPFTGEGIAWALTTGVSVVPFALKAVQQWIPSLTDQWTEHYHHLLGSRQSACRQVTWLLRHPTLTRATVGVLSLVPQLTAPLVHSINTA
ncbi:MAG: FAD-dependent monooxygenase [Elusimicrobia bacterium]|nr:FAD-dependent monooxygenase [Elusimicrobiota bacterium]